MEENKKEENDMIVYFTSKYEKTVNEKNQTVVNNSFVIYDKLGEGSYWRAFKVKRNYISGDFVDDNYYIFKEGLLSIKDDEVVYSLMMFTPDEKEKMTKEETEVRLGVREFNILRYMNNINIARLYEAIIDTSKNIIVFVMEYCDLGTLMNINSKENGLEYNHKLIFKALEYGILESSNFTNEEYINLDYYKKENLNLFDDHPKAVIKLSIFMFKQLARAINHLQMTILLLIEI